MDRRTCGPFCPVECPPICAYTRGFDDLSLSGLLGASDVTQICINGYMKRYSAIFRWHFELFQRQSVNLDLAASFLLFLNRQARLRRVVCGSRSACARKFDNIHTRGQFVVFGFCLLRPLQIGVRSLYEFRTTRDILRYNSAPVYPTSCSVRSLRGPRARRRARAVRVCSQPASHVRVHIFDGRSFVRTNDTRTRTDLSFGRCTTRFFKSNVTKKTGCRLS